jgi:rRNA-processing protein FCF1
MRINRSKVVRKCLKFFRLIYNLQAPFNIILDANFIIEALDYKIDIFDRLLKLLQCTEVRLHILNSALELLKQGINIEQPIV